MSGETALSAGIQKTLTLKGCKVIRIQSGMLQVAHGDKKHWVHCAQNGTPDLLVLRPPAVCVFLEVKGEGGKLNPDQQRWHEWAVSHGYRVCVVRTIDEALRAVYGDPRQLRLGL
jgi:hypothetical protein